MFKASSENSGVKPYLYMASMVCPVMCYVVGVIGIIGATSTTYSMKYFKKQAGTASAVIGSLSF